MNGPAADRSDPRADEALIAAVLGGDREAYRALIERYQRPYLLYAMRMLPNRGVAEDVVQDSFIAAYQELERCENPERFAAWCFRIVRNRCHDHLRGPQSRSAGPEPLRRLASEAEDPAEGAERTDLRAAITAALDALSPLLREAFVLYHEEALTYPEMSERLDASESALKMRVKRARETLQDQLSAYRDHIWT